MLEPDPPPDHQLLTIAGRIQAMGAAGDLSAMPDAARRELLDMPMALMNIAGDVRLLRQPEGREPDRGVVVDIRRVLRGRLP